MEPGPRILSVAVEVLGLVLVFGGCKLALFELELDPHQLLVVFVMDFLSGLMVVWRSDQIRTWFREKVKVEVL